VVRPLRRELLVWWAACSGGLTLAALGLTAWRACRISARRVRLADAIARSRPGDGSNRSTQSTQSTCFALDSRDDEVGLLARHLDALTARTVRPSSTPRTGLHARCQPRAAHTAVGAGHGHASPQQNQALFDAIPSQDKKHLRFESGHLLPTDYVEQLSEWFKI